MSSYNDCDVMGKKTPGLKEYKKQQKAKKCAKRTAAAKETKAKTTRSAFTAVTGASDIMSTKVVSADQELMVVTPEPKVIFDVVAHRKALEAALYEKMGTPVEMLVRCKYQLSLDAEYHTMNDGPADAALGAKCVDDNGFEAISHMASSENYDILAIEETPLLLQEISDAEKIVVRLPRATEAAQYGSISLEHLFAAVAAKEKVAIATSQKAMPCTALHNSHWMDPAILGYKIKQQVPERDSNSTTNSSRSSFSMSTPDSSPVKTRRSYTSSSSESGAPSWTPPTTTFSLPGLGHWAHYPEPKPCNIMDWSPPHWPMGQWR